MHVLVLVAAFSSSLGMLGFHISFCEYTAGSQSARGVSKWHFRSLIINQGSKVCNAPGISPCEG